MAGQPQKMGKTHRLIRASHNKLKGRGLARFLHAIKKRGRWRGHKFDMIDHLKGGSVDAKPKNPGSNKPPGNHVRY